MQKTKEYYQINSICLPAKPWPIDYLDVYRFSGWGMINESYYYDNITNEFAYKLPDHLQEFHLLLDENLADKLNMIFGQEINGVYATAFVSIENCS
jgi:hypothetical protein